jgi:glycosyltransferase involved in cell wall biosynthesis
MLFFPKSVYLASMMQRRGIQHIHAHFASHPAAAAWIIHRFSGIGYSFVAHGSDLHRDQHMLKEKVHDARFVAAISEYNRNMILDVCGSQYQSKIDVVHCGIDPTRFAPRSTPTPFDQANGPFRLLCIGTLHEVKGQRFLIEACKILSDKKMDWQCHFIGDGSDRSMLEALARELGVHDRIVFHGTCTSDTVRRELLLSDVLVTPSVMSRDGRREGIPVVLMEAMATGIPCIASRISGIPELVEDGITGILTPQRDVPSIANAALRLASDSNLRQTMGQAAVGKIQASFTLRQNALLLIDLIARAVSEKGLHHVE